MTAMEYKFKHTRHNGEIVKELEEIVGKEFITTNRTILYAYLRDASPEEGTLPFAVVKPGTTKEVSKILELGNEKGFKVYVRGGGN